MLKKCVSFTDHYLKRKQRMSSHSHPALIIAGMHRSGTSMISSYLNDVGIALGDQFLQTDRNNPKGYFEDEEMLRFQQKVMAAACKGGKDGWPDWGYTEDLKWDSKVLEKFSAEARSLIEKRRGLGRTWGWKDPRSTLLLEFWSQIIPEAKFLLLYRNPWEVKRSIKNLKAPIFQLHDDYAFKIWKQYNAAVLDFKKKNPDRCLLLSSNAFLTKPSQLVEELNDKFSWNLDKGAAKNYGFYSGDLFYSEVCDVELQEFNNDSSVKNLLTELDLNADLVGDRQLSSGDKGNVAISKGIVSVVIPCFNHGSFIKQAIFSVEKSRNKNFEIIIVDDGSTDMESKRVLLTLEKNGYNVLRQENSGLASARNAGIKLATGDFILCLDADNKIDPQYISEAIALFSNDDKLAVVYSNCRLFGAESGMREVRDFNAAELLRQNYIDACAIVRKTALLEVGGFDSKMPVQGYEDWELWINLFSRGSKFYHIDKFLFDYRVSPVSMSSNMNMPKNRKLIYDYVLKKHELLFKEYSSEVISLFAENFAKVEQLAWDRQSVIENLRSHISMTEQSREGKVVQKYRDINASIKSTNKKATGKFYRVKELLRKASHELKPASANAANESWSVFRFVKFFVSAKGRNRIKKLLKRSLKLIVKMTTGRSVGNQDYDRWRKLNFPNANKLLDYSRLQKEWEYRPLVSVILPVFNPNTEYLKEAIESVSKQAYDNWELCIVDDCSVNDSGRILIESYSRDDSRIKYKFRTENGHIVHCSNDALSLAKGEFVCFLDHDDFLAPDALYHVVKKLNASP
ncbi:MAG: glycosyltransferase, partial [Bacteroidia bacterium]|nr:glycosyltransferase [Bacteroidia bacterium]